MVERTDGPVLIFDGECALCSRSVRLMLRWERKPGVVRFAPMQSPPARELLRAHNFDPDVMTSVVLIEQRDERDAVSVRSRAVLRLMRYLRAPWRWGRVLGVVPAWFLDPLYRMLAKHRYAIFGKADRCAIDERIAGRTL